MDDTASLLGIIVGTALLVLLVGVLVTGPAHSRQADDTSTRPAGYTPVSLTSPDWNKIPSAERTAFGITDTAKRMIMVVTATGDRDFTCRDFVESPTTEETVNELVSDPKAAAVRMRLGLVYTLTAISKALRPDEDRLPVLSVSISNVTNRAVLYSPQNMYFRQDGQMIPVGGTYRLLGPEEFTAGTTLAPGESVRGCIYVEDLLDCSHKFEFWYGHNYGIVDRL